jgi:predicted nucleic acid-binding protein
VLVVDASVVAAAVGDDAGDGDQARSRLRGETLTAPELLDLEVASVLRRQVASGAMAARRAGLALVDLAELPLQRVPHRGLIDRCWQLRDNVSIYDAAHVALAEAIGADLLTADGRLARAPGLKCRIEVL